MTIFVTGGLGFIGSNFIHRYLSIYPDDDIVIVDNQSYAASIQNIPQSQSIILETIDIRDYDSLVSLYDRYKPDFTFNFAAQTHVDNSIRNDDIFISTNINGTHNILKCIKQYDSKLLHISTDEVFGTLNYTDTSFTETSQYKPNNPYSASKAASDLLVRSYVVTHNIKAVITNCSNNYGPRQHQEKFIPTIINSIKHNVPIPVYGNGSNIRDWLYVDDHCDALIAIKNNFISGEKYNIGGDCEVTNLDIVKLIIKLLGKSENLIQFVVDRPGHDLRYSINASKINQQLGWKPKVDLETGILQTIKWYYNA